MDINCEKFHAYRDFNRNLRKHQQKFKSQRIYSRGFYDTGSTHKSQRIQIHSRINGLISKGGNEIYEYEFPRVWGIRDRL